MFDVSRKFVVSLITRAVALLFTLTVIAFDVWCFYIMPVDAAIVCALIMTVFLVFMWYVIIKLQDIGFDEIERKENENI